MNGLPNNVPNLTNLGLAPDYSIWGVKLVSAVTPVVAPFWWAGLLLVLFCWVVVPVQRARHNVLGRDDYSSAARFWWSPGLMWLGVSGVGYSLLALPLMCPDLALSWAPGCWPWFGYVTVFAWDKMGLMVIGGLLLLVKGLILYAHSWYRVAGYRYEAYQWRMGTVPRPSRREEPEDDAPVEYHHPQPHQHQSRHDAMDDNDYP